MSSYANFYIRVNESFVPIGSYSRSTSLYQAINSMLPYGQIIALTSEKIGKAIEIINEEIENIENTIEKDEQECKEIANMLGNSINEKMSAIYSIKVDIEDMKQDLIDRGSSKSILQVYLDMIDEIHYSSEYIMDNDYNHYIYAGIEAYGRIEDILEEEN